jgi:hypothetical protein
MSIPRQVFTWRLLGLAVPLLLLPADEAAAQACLLPPAKLSQSVMETFKERPRDLQKRFPAGGPALSVEIMRRVGSDLAVLPLVMQIAQDGNEAQKVAIGMGLARICAVCAQSHPEVMQEVKKAVGEAGIHELTVAFAAGLASLTVAAVHVGASAEVDVRPVTGDLPAGGGTSQRPVIGGGDATTNGEGDQLAFSSKGITSTFRSSVSPTRR